MSRVVVLTPSLPLPFGAADARWLCALLPELVKRGHEVLCLSCTEESAEAVQRAELVAGECGFAFRHVPFVLSETTLQRKLQSLVHPHSEFARIGELRRVLDQECARGWDVLHVEHLYSAWATRDLPRAVTYLHFLGDVDWAGRRDLTVNERIERIQLGRVARQLIGSSQPLIAMTERLATEVALHGGALPPVVPIALDMARYQLQPFVAEPVLGVIGSMHWYPSRAAAERVIGLWPQIRERVPDATLKVAGWGSEQYLGRHFPMSGAELVGTVDDPESFFGQIALLVYPPPQGTGMKIKVMEAFAYGVPVLSNAEGLEGLGVRDGVEAVIAETDAEIVDRAATMLADAERRHGVRLVARRLVEDELTIARSVDRLLLAYEGFGLAP